MTGFRKSFNSKSIARLGCSLFSLLHPRLSTDSDWRNHLVCTTAVGRGSKAGSPLRSAPALHRVELNGFGLVVNDRRDSSWSVVSDGWDGDGISDEGRRGVFLEEVSC